MKSRDMLMLWSLAALWGASFLFMRLGVAALVHLIWGALFLREAITLNVVMGLTVILINVGLVMDTPPFRKKRPVG